ncbi:phytosulfokines 3-like [Euphorbia lathyris]|uniref:phytosulfokines 3-like n=1 Tax=Euphorbia lathyris TaxID=212925 RepID=UPI00331442B5
MVKIKVVSLFLVALLLCSSGLTFAGRPQPAFSNGSTVKSQNQGVEAESCDGVGEEECLMRRTLAAHTDYIYTQNHNP